MSSLFGIAPDNPAMFGLGGWGLAAIGAALGVVASMWSKAKDVMWRILGLVIQRVEIPTQNAHDAITALLINKYKRSRNYDRMYGAQWEFHRDGRYGLIPYEVFGNRTMIFWNGLFPFIFTNQQEKKTTAKGENSNSNATKIYSTITFVRGTLNVEKILTDACNVRNETSWANAQAEQEAKSRFGVRRWRSGASGVRSNFRWPVRRRCGRLLRSC